MSICLGFDSALSYLRIPAGRTARHAGMPICLPALSEQRGGVPGLCSPTAHEAETLLARYAPDIQRPLHVLVSDPNERRALKHVRTHLLASPLPRRLCVQAESDVYVAGPELCLAHMARGLDAYGLVELGFELCGTYAMGMPSDVGVTYDVEPLTSIRRLSRRLAAMTAGHRLMQGARKAAAMLEYVLDCSGSPRETHQAMLLCLSQALGGYALGHPRLNYRLDVEGEARRFTNRSYYVCDAYWPEAKLDVEYDSDAYHADPLRIASDAARRNALSAMGVTVITITNAQVRDADEFDRVARIIAGKLGRSAPELTPAFRQKRAALREHVTGHSRNPGFGRFPV